MAAITLEEHFQDMLKCDAPPNLTEAQIAQARAVYMAGAVGALASIRARVPVGSSISRLLDGMEQVNDEVGRYLEAQKHATH